MRAARRNLDGIYGIDGMLRAQRLASARVDTSAVRYRRRNTLTVSPGETRFAFSPSTTIAPRVVAAVLQTLGDSLTVLPMTDGLD